MCGVVSYFGDTPDALSRIITGMSAIIYRAPDSTGIGMFGHMSEPAAMRKCLGSIANLMPVLSSRPLVSGDAGAFFRSTTAADCDDLSGQQKALLDYEAIKTDHNTGDSGPSVYFPSFEALEARLQQRGVSGLIGACGRPCPLPGIRVRSRNDFKTMARSLIEKYNLSSVAARALIRDQVMAKLDRLTDKKKSGETAPHNAEPIPCLQDVTRSDILAALEGLLEATMAKLQPFSDHHAPFLSPHINPKAMKVRWQLISRTVFRVPDDLDPDPVRRLFRLIDSAVLSAVPSQQGLLSALDEKLKTQMSGAAPADWISLYTMEKSLNVCGHAATAALSLAVDMRPWLAPTARLTIPADQPEADIRQAHLFSAGQAASKIPETLYANYLACLSQPVIGHGRWALQSSVTVNNAHPFTDQQQQRLIALNGQFSADTEEEMKTFLTRVAGLSLRTENSAEYLALFWGYYYDTLQMEKDRFYQIEQQVELGLEGFGTGNTTINYRIHKQLKHKSNREIDEMAFIRSARLFTLKGGQIAVTGISMASPETLYAAASNRPLFVVRRMNTSSFMVVSDINAALGLFTQKEILEATSDYQALSARRDQALSDLSFNTRLKARWNQEMEHYETEMAGVLSRLRVEVFPMQGKDMIAVISTHAVAGRDGCRTVQFKDFEGELIHDVTPEYHNLTPPHVHKDIHSSFFESHLNEVPELLRGLNTAFMEDGTRISPLQINCRTIQRRFGDRLQTLKRLVLVGMGSSFHAARSSVPFVRRCLPRLQVICLRPVDILLTVREFNPDQDLVLMVSWSGTTADMVDLAGKLVRMGTVCIGVTEKTVGDLALITRKSGGVLHLMSNEEVTVPAVKSPFCSAMALHLFALWIKKRYLSDKKTTALENLIAQVPDILAEFLDSTETLRRIEETAFQYADASGMVIIGDTCNTGTPDEAAMKIEEMCWQVKTRALDYQALSVPTSLNQCRLNHTRILFCATSSNRVQEALRALEQLSNAGLDVMVLACEGRDLKRIRSLSGQVILIPRMPKGFQHLVDMIFFHWFAFYSGRARGRIDDEMPRNRAKSITTSRSVPLCEFAPKNEIFALRHRETLFDEPPPVIHTASEHPAAGEWEKDPALSSSSRTFIHHIRSLTRCLCQDQPLQRLMDFSPDQVADLSGHLFPADGSHPVYLIPMGPVSLAAARQTVSVLKPVFPSRIQCMAPGESLRNIPSGAVLVHMTADSERPAESGRTSRNSAAIHLWLHPSSLEQTGEHENRISIPMKQLNGIPVDECRLYTGLMVLLLEVWMHRDPGDAGLVLRHFKRSDQAVSNILDHIELLEQIRQAVRRNRSYSSLLYLSPSDGSGPTFTRRINTVKHWFTQHQAFGSSAHGPLVTIDSDVTSKYIRLASRSDMVGRYGRHRVTQWEKKYLTGMSVDAFLDNGDKQGDNIVNTPFFCQGDWFLPLLKDDFNPAGDNLVILDASNDIFFEPAIDDLTIFGSRQARMILISQETFINTPEKKALKKYPLSGMILIPSMAGEDRPVPLSHCHILFATALIGTAVADALSRTKTTD